MMFKNLWMFLYTMIIDVICYAFDDATMWHDYIDIYYKFYVTNYIRVSTLVLRFSPVRFYGDNYVATRLLWTDLWRGNIWA